jgi:hypothetical protein
MMTIIPIALVAGAASALMFASIVSGALTSLLLFYLAPLPLMVAALGWGPLSAGIGGVVASIGLGAIFGLPYCLAFVLTVALPACWLGHLALLGRPVSASAGAIDPAVPPAIEWYPVGRILLWTAGFAALTTMAALLTLGGDAATITAALRRGLLRIMGVRDPASASGDAEHFADALVAMAPAGAAIVAMMTLTLNLWLAAKITATSGRLHRPWPDLKTAALPPLTLAALSLALALCFVGGLAAMLAQIVSAALVMAYGLIGFAVLHTLTLSMKSRPIWLGGTYAMVLMIGWPILAMVGLGLADAVFGFRQRYLQRRTPPAARPDLSS